MLLTIQLKVVGNRPYAESVLQLKQSEAIQGVVQMGARHGLPCSSFYHIRAFPSIQSRYII